MSTVDTCTTPKEGWELVSHFLGNILCVVHTVVNDKRDDWESIVVSCKTRLTENLKKIVKKMADNGHTEDSAKIDEIRKMVEEGDLTNSATIDAIHAKNLEYNENARAMEEKVKELFGKNR